MRKLTITAAVLLICGSAAAQSLGFLNVNSDPSTAGSAVAAAPGAFSAENNIAATAVAEKYFGVGFAYESWQPAAAHRNVINLGAWGCIAKRIGIGLSAKFWTAKEYTGTNDKGGSAGNFTPKENLVAIGVSGRIWDGLAIGAKYKFVSSELWEKTKGAAHLFDVSLMYSWKNRVRAGLSVENLGAGIRYSRQGGGEAYPEQAAPSMVRAGAAWKFFEKGDHGILASLGADYLFAGDYMIDAGLVYNWKKLEARAGYHYGNGLNAVPSYASLGAGYEFFGVGIHFKYLFASPTLANSFLLGLTYQF